MNKVSRAEALRQVRFGPDDDRDDKAPPTSWTKGLGGPTIAAIIENVLSRQERQILRKVLKVQ